MNQSLSGLQRLGRSELKVSSICVGANALGSKPELYGHETSVEEGVATVRATFAGPFNFMDTSNVYGAGESERRIGLAIHEARGLPDGFVLATKIDGVKGVLTSERVRRSFAESTERLGVATLPLLFLHDPHRHISFAEAMAPGGPVEEMQRLRDEGLVSSLGIAMGPVDAEAEFIRTGAFDVMLTHSRYSLVDRSGSQLIDEARALDIGVVNAAVFGGGILAKGPGYAMSYAYGQGGEVQARAIAAMHASCERAGVPLKAAALQFSTRDARIDSTAVGMSKPERIAEVRQLLDAEIPEGLWTELESLAPGPDAWIPASSMDP